MTTGHDPSAIARIRRLEQRVLVVFFLVALALPLALLPTGWDPAAALGRGEKRKPVPFPALGGSEWTLRRFTQGLDAWCGDHFGLRRTLILANSLVDVYGFGVSPAPSVVPGRDGWLFYAGDRKMEDGNPIWDIRGVRPLSPYALERIRWMLQDQHEWLAARGIPYLWVLVPAKEEIYTEHLPAYATRAGPFTPREQVLRHLRACGSPVPVLDLTPAIRDEARRERCFLKTDTHWNAWGGLVGARAILRRVQDWFPAMTLPRGEDYDRTVRRDLGGDLAAQMALDAFLEEDYVVLTPRLPRRAEPRPLSTIEDPELEAETGDASLPRAVIYRDSYSNILVPTLSEHFRWVRFVWGRTGTEMRGVVDLKPDVVLQIMADRALRLPLRYSADMQRERLAARFAASDRVLLNLAGPAQVAAQVRPAGATLLDPTPEGVILRADRTGCDVELPGLGGVASALLPVVRLQLWSPRAGSLQVSWRNARTGDRVPDRINLRRGNNELYLALYDPELAGSVLLSAPREFSGLRLQSVEIRGHPR